MRTPEWEEAPSFVTTPSSPSQSPVRNASPHPSQATDPVTVIASRGGAAIYHESDDTKHPALGTNRSTRPTYDALPEFEDDEAEG